MTITIFFLKFNFISFLFKVFFHILTFSSRSFLLLAKIAAASTKVQTDIFIYYYSSSCSSFDFALHFGVTFPSYYNISVFSILDFSTLIFSFLLNKAMSYISTFFCSLAAKITKLSTKTYCFIYLAASNDDSHMLVLFLVSLMMSIIMLNNGLRTSSYLKFSSTTNFRDLVLSVLTEFLVVLYKVKIDESCICVYLFLNISCLIVKLSFLI